MERRQNIVLVKTIAIKFFTFVLALTVVMQPLSNAPAQGNRRNYGILTGTWQLNTSRSDDVDQAVERAIRSLPANEHDRARARLTRRLDAPETIAIDQRGRRFTIASPFAPEATFDADGRTRTETTERGRSIRVTVALRGDQLAVNRTGS